MSASEFLLVSSLFTHLFHLSNVASNVAVVNGFLTPVPNAVHAVLASPRPIISSLLPLPYRIRGEDEPAIDPPIDFSSLALVQETSNMARTNLMEDKEDTESITGRTANSENDLKNIIETPAAKRTINITKKGQSKRRSKRTPDSRYKAKGTEKSKLSTLSSNRKKSGKITSGKPKSGEPTERPTISKQQRQSKSQHDPPELQTKMKTDASKGVKDTRRKQTSKQKSSQNSQNSQWHQRYQELIQFQKRHGHSLIPQNYPPNPKLGHWVMAQRRQYALREGREETGEVREGTSDTTDARDDEKKQPMVKTVNDTRWEERKKLLDEIGFVWKVDRRGPRGSYGTLKTLRDIMHRSQRSNSCGDNHSSQDNIGDGIQGSNGNNGSDGIEFIIDFEEYVIRQSQKEHWTDEEIGEAWRKRFEILEDNVKYNIK